MAKETKKEREEKVDKVKKEIAAKDNQKKKKKINDYIPSSIFAFLVGIVVLIASENVWVSLASLIGGLLVAKAFFILSKEIEKTVRIQKMEEIFPDFIELMASNLRAGMTVDKAMLLSSRKEFAPLDKEILALGKDIVTGKDISKALREMADRIGSEKISKTVDLINSGMKAGGNLSVLLEETAVNMREKMFIEKKASSNVLMYVIFIFFASSVGAPMLFALSNVLVEVMTRILSDLPDTGEVASSLPISFGKIAISTGFATVFSVLFLIVSNILASLILGITNKGNEKAGLKFLVPMLILSLTIFFLLKILLSGYFIGLF
jgi:archaellum biogenesis protein FlaJ (TadC family)